MDRVSGRRLDRGAHPGPDGTRFSVWAPAARSVTLRILSGPGAGDHTTADEGGGVHACVVPERAVGADYVWVLGREKVRPDPVSRSQPAGVHGPSRVVDPAAFSWTDASWSGLGMKDLVLYELHVGTFTEAGTFDAVGDHLAELRDLGVTAIELMPVAEFPGGRNWGYDGVFPYAPQSTYGGPDGLRRLVDRAHAAGLGVVLDVVYNHLGPEGNVLHDFGPYFSGRYRTPWGDPVNFDGPDSDEVRRYFVDNALHWVTEYHVDGLRLDAVHAIFDFGALHILEEIAAAVHAEAERRGRRVLVIAESDRNDPRLVRPPERGGYGLDGVWSDDFHHAIHAWLTGERTGYYVDFGGLEAVAKGFRDRWVYDGARSVFRRRRHGAPAADLPAERFVVFAQNHDQVGNRARGDRLATLVGVEGQKLATCLVLLSPYVPLLFMGEEWGATSPFLYFVSHGDPELVRAVRSGRRKEFAAFGWEDEVPDPQAEETFRRSRPDRREREAEPHRHLYALYRDLLALRREEPQLWPGATEVRTRSGEEWLVVSLGARERPPLHVLFNFATHPEVVPVPEPAGASLPVRFSSDDGSYGGAGRAVEAAGAGELLIPPRSAIVVG